MLLRDSFSFLKSVVIQVHLPLGSTHDPMLTGNNGRWPMPSFASDIHPEYFSGIDGAVWLDEQLIERHKSARSYADLVRHAWYLRQRDSRLAGELLSIAQEVGAGEPGGVDWRLRALLTGAELLRLHGDIVDAEAALEQVGEQLDRLDQADIILLGDWSFLSAELSLAKGRTSDAQAHLSDAIAHYAGDDTRRLMAEGALAFQQQYERPIEAQRRWDDHFAQALVAHPATQAYVQAYRGSICFQFGQFPDAIRRWTDGYEAALTAGALSLAIQLAAMIGSSFANLYDLPTAMEWKERAYDLAKGTRWPFSVGMTLASMAETTVTLQNHVRARELFEEALTYIGDNANTRRHVILFNAYGNLLLELRNPEEALSLFDRGRALAQTLDQPDIEAPSLAGAALALARQGDLEGARQAAERSRLLAVEHQYPYHEIQALQALAEVQKIHDHGDPRRAIATLEEAVTIANTMDRFVVRSDLFSALAVNYESLGDHERALHYERRSRESWQRNFDRQNGARIQALQVRFDTARAKAEAEHHRKLAEAEATRAAELDRANQTLERLGVIGQEITARLDGESVFTTLSRHLHDLMHANTLFVGLKDEANQVIDIRYRTEDGKRLPPRQVLLASDNLSARCVRDNQEILVAWGDRVNPNSVAGTRHMRTVLFRPLALGSRVLGVVSVQSDRPNAYGPRELLIFRTICAYGAIAMANAEAYQQLDRAVGETREALQRLVQQEKMAALGQLVAGVAHEVNTPLGVTLSAVSQLNDSIRHLHGQVEKGLLTRSVLTEALDNGRELAALAQRNVTRAADMIRTFKGVAVDHGSDERRVFELGEYLSEIMSLIRARVAGNGNRIEIDVAPIQMDTYPGALAQVITNLVANIADHAYAPDRPGRIILRGRSLDAYMVEIAVVDQGTGIPGDILPKVFDPFFTTRRAAGSMGLGLHVVFNQVTQRLNGSITIDSVLGQGTVATVRIPREVPGFVPAAFFPVHA